MVQPIEGKLIVTQTFAQHLANGNLPPGIDYQTLPKPNQPCFCIEKGLITFVGQDNIRGSKYIQLNADSGNIWMLVHLDGFAVSVGQRVEEGQQAGICGTSGNVAPHIHINLLKNGVYVDPDPILQAINNINMDEFTIIPAKIAKNLGDCLLRAGISDPTNAGQKQNVANLNKTWLTKNGVDENGRMKSHNGTWQDMESKLAVGDIVRVRGIPGTPPFPVAPVTPPTPSTDPDGVKWREYSKLSKELIK